MQSLALVAGLFAFLGIAHAQHETVTEVHAATPDSSLAQPPS